MRDGGVGKHDLSERQKADGQQNSGHSPEFEVVERLAVHEPSLRICVHAQGKIGNVQNQVGGFENEKQINGNPARFRDEQQGHEIPGRGESAGQQQRLQDGAVR